VGIVGRSSRPREVHAHLVMVSSEIDDLPGELGAIVHKHGRRRATLAHGAI
jgi:hypothetical protein